MSRPLLDDYRVGMATRNEAVPALERLAENGPLREQSLSFDHDDPPPYTPFPEDDDEEEDVPPVDETIDETVDATVNETVDEIRRLLDEPLTDEEYKRLACTLDYQLDPGRRYNLELEFELERVHSSVFDRTETTKKYFHEYSSVALNRAGEARKNIIARRNIKRRWQKLGVWNPVWGIPGREDNPLPKDNEKAWKWPWQQDDAVAAPSWWTRDPRPAVIRALDLRRGMRQNDHSPVIPRSRLGKDVSASQAESFLTSRPWFMLEVEQQELTERTRRVWRAHGHGVQCRSVTTFWKERGDWKEEWPRNYRTHQIGWKWRHESPSPEPEDLTRLDDPTFELTPSEVDALEAVRPPAPPPPLVYWEPPPGYVPLFGTPLTREEVEALNREPPPSPVRWARLCQSQQPPVEDDLDESSPPQTSEDQGQEDVAEPVPRSTRKRGRQEDEAEQQSPPPQRRQTRPRQTREEPAEQASAPPPPRQKRQRRIPAEGQPPGDPPARRNSARIAATAAATATAAPRVRNDSAESRPRGSLQATPQLAVIALELPLPLPRPPRQLQHPPAGDPCGRLNPNRRLRSRVGRGRRRGCR